MSTEQFKPGKDCKNRVLCAGISACWEATLLTNDLDSGERGYDTDLAQKATAPTCGHPDAIEVQEKVKKFLRK